MQRPALKDTLRPTSRSSRISGGAGLASAPSAAQQLSDMIQQKRAAASAPASSPVQVKYRYTPSTTRSAATGQTVTKVATTNVVAESAQGVRDDYITNLQQQIYFLELENNLLKKAGTATASAGGPQSGKGAAPNPFADIDPSGPLEGHLATLRAKYLQMEAEYKAEMQSLRDELDAAKRSAGVAARETELIAKQKKDKETALDDAQREIKFNLQTALDTKLHHEKRIEKLEGIVAAKAKDYELLLEQSTRERAQREADDEKRDAEQRDFNKKFSDLTRRCDALTKQLRTAEITVTELRAELKSNEFEAELKAQTAKYEKAVDERMVLELQLKKALLDLDRANDSARRIVDARDKALAENVQLRGSVLKLENKIETDARQAAARERDGVTWSSQLVDLKTEVTRMTVTIQDTPQQISALNQVIANRTAELVAAKQSIMQLEDALTKSKQEIERIAETDAKVEETNVQLTKGNLLLQQQLAQLQSDHERLNGEMERAQKLQRELEEHNRELTDKTAIAKSLEDLKVHEFAAMAKTNLAVADSIHGLMSRLQPSAAPAPPPITPTPKLRPSSSASLLAIASASNPNPLRPLTPLSPAAALARDTDRKSSLSATLSGPLQSASTSSSLHPTAAPAVSLSASQPVARPSSVPPSQSNESGGSGSFRIPASPPTPSDPAVLSDPSKSNPVKPEARGGDRKSADPSNEIEI